MLKMQIVKEEVQRMKTMTKNTERLEKKLEVYQRVLKLRKSELQIATVYLILTVNSFAQT